VVKRQRERGMRVSEGEYRVLLQLQPRRQPFLSAFLKGKKGRVAVCMRTRDCLWVVASSHDANIAKSVRL
jgi:hypothetical protein